MLCFLNCSLSFASLLGGHDPAGSFAVLGKELGGVDRHRRARFKCRSGSVYCRSKYQDLAGFARKIGIENDDMVAWCLAFGNGAVKRAGCGVWGQA